MIGAYLEGVREENQSDDNLGYLRDILKKETESKYIGECYSVEELISKQLTLDLCRLEGKHEKEMSIKYIKSFIKR